MPRKTCRAGTAASREKETKAGNPPCREVVRDGFLCRLRSFGAGESEKRIPPARDREAEAKCPAAGIPPNQKKGRRISSGKTEMQQPRIACGGRPHSVSHPLQTSTHAADAETRSSSPGVSSMALLLLPQAGKTVSNRFRDTSR